MKEKYYTNEKTHLATEKIFVLHHSLKINKRGGPIKLRGVGKNRKINKRPPRLLGTKEYWALDEFVRQPVCSVEIAEGSVGQESF